MGLKRKEVKEKLNCENFEEKRESHKDEVTSQCIIK